VALNFPLRVAIPSPPASPSLITDAGSGTTSDEMTPFDDADNDSASGYDRPMPPDQMQPPDRETRNQESPDEIVAFGPLMYVYFSAADTSDAGFTINLLFQHPDYPNASQLLLFL